MNRKLIVLAVAAGMALTTSVAADTVVITEPEVKTIVTKAGYREPIVITQDGKLWRVVSVDKDNDQNVTLFVDSKGEVLGAADVARTQITQTTTTTTTTETAVDTENPTSQSKVAAIVADAGFHNVHDIDFLDGKGVWKAEADDITGEDYELHVNALSGRIVHIEDD